MTLSMTQPITSEFSTPTFVISSSTEESLRRTAISYQTAGSSPHPPTNGRTAVSPALQRRRAPAAATPLSSTGSSSSSSEGASRLCPPSLRPRAHSCRCPGQARCVHPSRRVGIERSGACSRRRLVGWETPAPAEGWTRTSASPAGSWGGGRDHEWCCVDRYASVTGAASEGITSPSQEVMNDAWRLVSSTPSSSACPRLH